MDIEEENKEQLQQNKNKEELDYKIFQVKYYQEKNNQIFDIKIKNNQYKIDFNDKVTAEILGKDTNFLNIIYNLEADIQPQYQKKQQQKIKEIYQITNDHCYYTPIESFLEHISALIDFVKRDPEKNKDATSAPEQELDKCCICMCELFENIYSFKIENIMSLLQVSEENFKQNNDVIQLTKCMGQHGFHVQCLLNMLKQQKNTGFLQCPVCQQIYGILKGNQPEGKMNVQLNNSLHCSGYEKYGTIIIQYNIHGHKPGTQRTAYLPNTKEGNEVLQLLKTAFERKLVFTIGTSVTTGQQNVVVWNGIHHKTNITGGSSHFGYPDPTYFSRVKQELAAKGIF